MVEALVDFHFLRPAWLLLYLPFALVLLLQRQLRDQARHWEPVIARHLLREMIVSGGDTRWLSPRSAARLMALIIPIALAGPSWQRAASPFAEDQAALVIALDLSASMAERDVQPSRLQRARDKILQLLAARGDAATALIAYAGSAHTVLPLTDDRDIVLHYLDALRVGMLPREGKAPEAVLPLARRILAERGSGGTLLLVSDGAGNESAAAFAELAAERSLQLLVWGIGKTQEDIDADAARGLASSAQPLQEAQLEGIAAAAGGRYRRLSVDDADIRYLQRRISRHFAGSDDSDRPWIDAGYFLLYPIALLLLLYHRRGWAMQW
jgi:Ca-activated chloride channel family protein